MRSLFACNLRPPSFSRFFPIVDVQFFFSSFHFPTRRPSILRALEFFQVPRSGSRIASRFLPRSYKSLHASKSALPHLSPSSTLNYKVQSPISCLFYLQISLEFSHYSISPEFFKVSLLLFPPFKFYQILSSPLFPLKFKIVTYSDHLPPSTLSNLLEISKCQL